MSYQNVVGTLTAKMCEGFCGQDAYNDLFIVEELNGSNNNEPRRIHGEPIRGCGSYIGSIRPQGCTNGGLSARFMGGAEHGRMWLRFVQSGINRRQGNEYKSSQK